MPWSLFGDCKVFVNSHETMEKIRRREEAVFLNEGDKGLWEPTVTLLSPKDQRVRFVRVK